jgi:hypothetical protein
VTGVGPFNGIVAQVNVQSGTGFSLDDGNVPFVASVSSRTSLGGTYYAQFINGPSNGRDGVFHVDISGNCSRVNGISGDNAVAGSILTFAWTRQAHFLGPIHGDANNVFLPAPRSSTLECEMLRASTSVRNSVAWNMLVLTGSMCIDSANPGVISGVFMNGEPGLGNLNGYAFSFDLKASIGPALQVPSACFASKVPVASEAVSRAFKKLIGK